MALTSTIVYDIVSQTSTLTFFNPTQIDQVVFSTNQITWETTSGYSLAKSDLLLFNQFLKTFNSNLFFNFPTLNAYINAIWPLCSFTVNETSVGVTHINYAQTSQGNSVLSLNYVPIAASGSIAARSSVTISIQEFFSSINFLAQYNSQVILN
jgi:hypothetical protein